MHREKVDEFERDGFDIVIYHMEDEDPDLSFLGEYTDGRGRKGLQYPIYDRAAERIFHDEQERIDWLDGPEEGVHWSGREYRFIHGFQKAADDRETWDKAILHDVERLESYNRGDWACVGVMATAGREGVVLGESMGIWGIETDSDKSYFKEVADEEASQAIDEAKEKLKRLRDDERWTEQQERLLRAAQDVVNDADYPIGPGERDYSVDRDAIDALKVIVKEISDDAVKAIEAIAKERR